MEAHQLTDRFAWDRAEWQARARRAFDIVVASLLLLLLSPLLLAVALAIRMDSPGPALFRQRRVGQHWREFTLLKFRSMRHGADSRGHREYVAALIRSGENGSRPNDHGGLYKLAVDERITRVGRLIRRWSIDELPQLLNVVAGHMTLVGPRPVIPYEVAEYPDWYGRRFEVKPGLTGLWQVSGRNERTYEEMVQLDIEYAQTRTFPGDLAILVKTPWVVLSKRGAG